MYRLFDSLMRSYPIQTLLFWRTKDEIKARRFMDEVRWEADLSDYYEAHVSKAGCEKVFVLDGQQRLQTLLALFRGTLQAEGGHTSQAYFDVTSGSAPTSSGLLYSVKFADAPLPRPWYRLCDLLTSDAQKNSEDLADEWNESLDRDDDAKDSDKRESSGERQVRQKRVRRNFAQVLSILREEKHFWVQQLDGVANQYPYSTVLDIFVRVNSGGTKLDASDLMFAAMKEGWDEIEEAIEETTELLNSTNLEFDKTFALKCLLVVRGRGAETSPEKFTGSDGTKLLSEMKEHWDKAEQAFRELRDFLKRDLKVYSDKVVRSYNSFIPLFDYLYHNPQPVERSKALMRGYYYKAQIFGWYSQATDTVVNALHGIVGKPCPDGFPIGDVKGFFSRRGHYTELEEWHLDQVRLRFVLLNLVYVDQMGSSPFDVKFKGNEPHVDHIYPRHGLVTNLALGSGEVNSIGNFRFVGATDNIRKRAERPASYFARLKQSGIPIEKHLLLDEFAEDPSRLAFDASTYRAFRNRRRARIWEICARTTNPESFLHQLGGQP